MKQFTAIFITCALLLLTLKAENLHLLVRQGDSIELDNKSQQQINELDEHGQTVLFYAALNQNDALVALLLEKGASADVENQLISPLWVASVQGNIPLIQLLIKHKADPFLISTKGFSAIGAAIISGRVEILTLLAKEISGDELLKHFSSDMRARTHGEMNYLLGEGMSFESAVRDAIRAKHASMALYLLNRGVLLLTKSTHPGGYVKQTPFCLFEGIQNQCMTVPLAAALIKAGENPYARVTSVSNISRSPMMPRSAMEAALLVGPYEVAEFLATKAAPEPEDFLGNLELFGYSNSQGAMKELGKKNFGKFSKCIYNFPYGPDLNHPLDSSIHELATRLVPLKNVEAEVFQRSEEKTKIAVFPMTGAEDLLPVTTQALNLDEMWTCVDTEELRNSLDADYWERDDVESGEIAKAVDARVICVVEVIKNAKEEDTVAFHLISGHSGLCVKTVSKRRSHLLVANLRIELTNAWRQWKDRCEMMEGKFHAIRCEENPTEPDLTKQTILALRSAPHVLPVTLQQAMLLKDSKLLRSSFAVKPTISHNKDSITIQMQLSGESLAEPLLANVSGPKIFELNLVQDCFCQISVAAHHYKGMSTETIDRFMQRMFATGHHEDSLFLANLLLNLDTGTNKYSTFRWTSIEKRISNFAKFVSPPSGIRSSYYSIVASEPLRKIHEYQPLMLHFSYILHEELRLSTKRNLTSKNTIQARQLGEKLRLLGYYKFFLRSSKNPEYMDQMDASISQLISSAREFYKTDEERLQLCLGIIGTENQSIAHYDLHRCVPLRDFITTEIFRLARLGIAKSAKLPLQYFPHSELGSCYRKVIESSFTAQARGSWDQSFGRSFEELHLEKNGADMRLVLERDFYRADETQRPEIARRIASLQCDAMRADRITFFTGVPLLDLSRYIPISLKRPQLFDRSEWNKIIVAKSLESTKCNGELLWHARIYHTEAAMLKPKDKKTSKLKQFSQNYFVIESKEGIYDLPNDLRPKIHFSLGNSGGTIDKMVQQSELLQKSNGVLLGEKKNIPDVTAPNSWQLAQKISILENHGKSDCILPLEFYFEKSTNTLYFACCKIYDNQKITLFDRKEIKSKAEIVALNLLTGKITRKEHPDYKMTSQFLIQENFKPILTGLENKILWIAPPAKVQMVSGTDLSLRSLDIGIKSIDRFGNRYATLGSTCFVQISESISDNMAKFEKRSKVLGFKGDGSVITVVDTKQSPTSSALDDPQNNLQGVFASGDRLHIFTNQSVTYQRVNPMMGISDASGTINEVVRDEKAVTKMRDSFVAKINPLSEKFPLSSGGFLYKNGLPGRLVIGNNKGKYQALPILLAGLDEEKLRVAFPIHGANYSIEYNDELPVSDFVKTVIVSPEIVAETHDSFYICSSFKGEAYLPYVWRIKKSDLESVINHTTEAN